MNDGHSYTNNNIDTYSNNSNYSRTNNIKYDRMDNNILFNNETNSKKNNLSMDYLNIYRYKLSPFILQSLLEFSKLHQFEDRIQFKENWMLWLKENEEIIEIEQNRLNKLNYNGNLINKMFKSARYYLRKKSTQKKEPQIRKNYICLSKDILDKMDGYLNNNIHLKPKDGFIEFCQLNKELLKESISNLYNSGIKDSNQIQEKIKKTFKNRYFKIHIIL